MGARLLRRQPLFNVCLFPNRRWFLRLHRGIFAPTKCRPFDRIAPVVEKLSAVAISDRRLAMSQRPAKSFSWLVFYRLTKAHTGDPVCFGRLSLGAVLYDHGHD